MCDEPDDQLKICGEVYDEPSTVIESPVGLVIIVIWPGTISKFAVTLFDPFIVRVAGLLLPLRLPLQFLKVYPLLAVAVSCTDWFGSYHGPDGLSEILPLPLRLTVVSRRYWVEKVAV